MSESNEDRDQDHRNNVRQQPESSFRSTQTAAVTAAAVTATRRASTYKLLSEELSEAQERIKAGSQDPNNYVLVGRLFSYQGNQQEAISVLEQGLRAVPADHQLVIQQQIDAAKTRLDRRIDFIAQCPYELVCNIAIYMETKTAIRCLFVSRSWRYKLLSCKELWRYVTLNGSGKMTMVRQTLFAVSEHIGTLYIHAQPGKIHRHLNALKAMASGNVDFASLEALIIQDNGENTEADLPLRKSLYSALSGISFTLTELDLRSQSFVAVSLGRLLSICRYLKCIRLNVYSLADASHQLNGIQNDNNNSEPFILDTLSIVCRWPMSPLLMESLRPVFPYVPHLRYLLLLYCSRHVSGDDLLTVLGDNCPKLEEIRYGSLYVPLPFHPESAYNNEHMQDDDDDDRGNDLGTFTKSTATTTTSIAASQRQSGLRCMIVDPIRSARFLSQRLANGRDTLRKMSLSMDVLSRATTVADWRPFSSFTMNQMTHLQVNNGCLGFYQQLPDMLRCFPRLEWLHLGADRTDMNIREISVDAEHVQNLLQALMQLTKLSTLHMDSFYILDQDFYERLMEHYVMVAEEQEISGTGVGQRSLSSSSSSSSVAATTTLSATVATPVSSLDALHIIDCQGFTCQALLQAAKIKSLHSFSVDLYKSKAIQEEVASSANELIRLLGNLPLLSALELGNMQLSNVGHLLVAILRSKANLKSIVLRNVEGLTRQDMELLKKYQTLSIR